MTRWLGEIPAGWRVVNPRRFFEERREPSKVRDTHLTPSQHYGVLPQAEYMAITGSRVVLNLTGADNMKHVEPGDSIGHLRSFQGGLETSALSGKVSNAYTVIRPKPEADPRYFRWVFKSSGFIAELAAHSQSLRDGQTVKFEDLASITLPMPPVEVQRRIADFLDDRVSRIDRIIAARREQNAGLTALHISSLQQLFDSLARNFGVVRLGHALRGLEQGWSPQAESQPAGPGEWGVMRAGSVNGGYFRPEDNKRLPDELEPIVRYEIRGGDLLMSRASGSLDLIGSVAVVQDDVPSRLLLCDKIYRLLPDHDWSSQFLAPMMRAHSNRERIRIGVSGAEGMANNLPSGVIRDLEVPAVAAESQHRVALEADGLQAQADRAKAALHRSIGLLTEYKSSLITAAVTGELDVTTAGSNIPG